MKLKNYINIAFIILWMLVIFNFSNQNGSESSGMSDKLIIKIAEFIKQDKIDTTEQEIIISKFKLIVRKSAHFISYFILSLLIIILFIDLKGLNKTSLLITITICFLYACSDEIHQLFINGRNGSFIDVLIDTTGAGAALILTYLYNYMKNKCIKNKQ